MEFFFAVNAPTRKIRFRAATQAASSQPARLLRPLPVQSSCMLLCEWRDIGQLPLSNACGPLTRQQPCLRGPVRCEKRRRKEDESNKWWQGNGLMKNNKSWSFLSSQGLNLAHKRYVCYVCYRLTDSKKSSGRRKLSTFNFFTHFSAEEMRITCTLVTGKNDSLSSGMKWLTVGTQHIMTWLICAVEQRITWSTSNSHAVSHSTVEAYSQLPI